MRIFTAWSLLCGGEGMKEKRFLFFHCCQNFTLNKQFWIESILTMFRQLVVFVILDLLLGLGLGLHVPIILDHPRFLVVSKPSGVAMHGEMNVLNQVRRQRGLGEGEGEGVAGGDNETLFSVHRLDTPTSGLLVFAKDADAAGKLQRGEGRS